MEAVSVNNTTVQAIDRRSGRLRQALSGLAAAFGFCGLAYLAGRVLAKRVAGGEPGPHGAPA
jgi:hypothetical protein